MPYSDEMSNPKFSLISSRVHALLVIGPDAAQLPFCRNWVDRPVAVESLEVPEKKSLVAGVLPDERDAILPGQRKRFLISVVVSAPKVRIEEQTSFRGSIPVSPIPHNRFFDEGQGVTTA